MGRLGKGSFYPFLLVVVIIELILWRICLLPINNFHRNGRNKTSFVVHKQCRAIILLMRVIRRILPVVYVLKLIKRGAISSRYGPFIKDLFKVCKSESLSYTAHQAGQAVATFCGSIFLFFLSIPIIKRLVTIANTCPLRPVFICLGEWGLL